MITNFDEFWTQDDDCLEGSKCQAMRSCWMYQEKRIKKLKEEKKEVREALDIITHRVELFVERAKSKKWLDEYVKQSLIGFNDALEGIKNIK